MLAAAPWKRLRLRGLPRRRDPGDRSSAAPSATSAAASTTSTSSRSASRANCDADEPLTTAARPDGRSRWRTHELRAPGARDPAGAERTLYSFAVDGKKLPAFAAVSRVQRDDRHELAGYQRAESLAHIKDDPASTSRPPTRSCRTRSSSRSTRGCASRPTRSADELGDVAVGELVIPVDEGQRRATRSPAGSSTGSSAPRRSATRDVERFPVYVTAFITDSVAEQRSQFILVNSTKPLPKGLIHELLPATPAGTCRSLLLKRRYPALLLDRLNYDADSPLQRRIRTPTTAEGTIKDNSILKMLAMSIEDGALYQ